jgi:hypothetical protein
MRQSGKADLVKVGAGPVRGKLRPPHFLLAIAQDGPQAAQIALCGAQRSRPEAMPRSAVFGLKRPQKTA